MTLARIQYEAEQFIRGQRGVAVEKRLVFDAWADRKGFGADLKRRLRRTVKSLGRRRDP